MLVNNYLFSVGEWLWPSIGSTSVLGRFLSLKIGRFRSVSARRDRLKSIKAAYFEYLFWSFNYPRSHCENFSAHAERSRCLTGIRNSPLPVTHSKGVTRCNSPLASASSAINIQARPGRTLLNGPIRQRQLFEDRGVFPSYKVNSKVTEP